LYQILRSPTHNSSTVGSRERHTQHRPWAASPFGKCHRFVPLRPGHACGCPSTCGSGGVLACPENGDRRPKRDGKARPTGGGGVEGAGIGAGAPRGAFKCVSKMGTRRAICWCTACRGDVRDAGRFASGNRERAAGRCCLRTVRSRPARRPCLVRWRTQSGPVGRCDAPAAVPAALRLGAGEPPVGRIVATPAQSWLRCRPRMWRRCPSCCWLLHRSRRTGSSKRTTASNVSMLQTRSWRRSRGDFGATGSPVCPAVRSTRHVDLRIKAVRDLCPNLLVDGKPHNRVRLRRLRRGRTRTRRARGETDGDRRLQQFEDCQADL
jgi:hypothetical protein